MIRVDYILSNWIFFYYIIFILKKNHKLPSPKLLFIMGLIHNLLSLLLISLYNNNYRIKYYYFIMMVIFKVLPLYTIYNTTNDYYFSLYLIIFYICWLIINNQNPYRFFTDSKKVIYSEKIILYTMKILDKCFTKFNVF